MSQMFSGCEWIFKFKMLIDGALYQFESDLVYSATQPTSPIMNY